MAATTQDFLRSFGTPLVLSLTDIKGVNSFKGRHLHHNTAVLSKVNEDPDTPYWLFFTPNGNYWAIQKEGQRISRSQVSPGPGPLYNALIVDIDLKDCLIYKTMEDLSAHIDEVLGEYWIPITYKVRSWWGFHLYWVINEDDRQAIHDMFGTKIFGISRYLCTLFDWWDPNSTVVRWDLNWIIRLPWSYHRKTWTPIKVEIVHEDLSKKLTLTHIETALRTIGESEKAVETNKDSQVIIWAENTVAINNIPFKDILLKLVDYPRLFDGKSQIFRLEGTNICIVDGDWNITRTDWYKYCREKNYINCFTAGNHPISERPRWQVFPFLFHYFNRNMWLLKHFLSKEFGVAFADDANSERENVLQTFVWGDYSVEMTDKRVILHKSVNRGKKSIDVHDDIFRKSFTILGKSRVKFHPNGTETDDEQMVYVMRVNNETKILYRFPTKKRFNEKYAWYLWFYGEDNDLWMFYESIDKTDVPVVKVTVLNWYYDDCVVLGWKVVRWESKERFITATHEFETKLSTEISLKEFYEMITEIYKEDMILPIFLQSIALAWMNIREGETVYPAILVSGRTGSGKSSIAEIMKNMLWYALNDRKIALPQITPQPFKIKATDNSILRCDELTASVNERVEECVRNIINKDKWWRGIGSENAHYNFRAPLFFTWERTFKDESLNNRMLAVIISEKDWQKDWFEKIQNIKEYSCIKAIYDWYQSYVGNINELHKSWAYKLISLGIKPRNADVWAYIFVVNEVMGLQFPKEKLIEITKKHLESMWFGEEQAITDEWEFQMYLSRMVFTRQAQCIIEQYKNKKIYRFIFIDETSYQKARWSFTSIVEWFNSHWQRIGISKNWISIEVRELEAETIDFVLDKIWDFVLSCNFKAIQYVNRQDEDHTKSWH